MMMILIYFLWLFISVIHANLIIRYDMHRLLMISMICDNDNIPEGIIIIAPNRAKII
jgi:hypothetical protein